MQDKIRQNKKWDKMNKMITGKAVAVYAHPSTVKRGVQININIAQCIINSVEQKIQQFSVCS